MEGNKYKLLMRISLADLDIVKGMLKHLDAFKKKHGITLKIRAITIIFDVTAKDENLRRIMNEVETLTQDVNTLTQISEKVAALHTPHLHLEEIVRDMLHSMNRQLSERQNSDTQLCYMEISLNTT